MSNLTQVINQVVEQALEQYTALLASKFDLDQATLKAMWKKVSCGMTPSSKSPEKVSSRTSSTSNGDKCLYKFVRGDKAGQPCPNSVNGGKKYCTTHKKYENSPPKEKKVLPSPKKSIGGKSKKGSPVPKKVDRILKIDKKLNVLHHVDTKLVFRSKSDRTVIGKIEDGEVVPLSSENLDECRRWNFKYEEPVADPADESSDSEEENEPKAKSVKAKTDETKVHLLADSSSGGKFWDASVSGSTVTVSYGKVGSNGRTTTKDFDTPALALKYLEKEKSKKLKKEYTEQSPVMETLAKPEEESDSEDSDDEAPAPKKSPPKPVPKNSPPKKKAPEPESSDSEDSDDEAPAPKKSPPKKKAEPESSDSESDLEDVLNDVEDSDMDVEHADKFVSKALGVSTEDSDLDEESE